MLGENGGYPGGVFNPPGGFVRGRLLQPFCARDSVICSVRNIIRGKLGTFLPDEKGGVLRDSSSNCIYHFHRQPNTVFETSSILIRAFIARRAQERRQEISMGTVNLDDVKPSSHRAFCSLRKRIHNILDALQRQLFGLRVRRLERHGRGAPNIVRPAPSFLGGDGWAVQPRSIRGAFASGVC